MNKKTNRKKNKIINREIATKYAMSIVILEAAIVGSLLWVYVKNQSTEGQQISQVTSVLSKEKNQIKKITSVSQPEAKLCTPHYYEGESKVQVWLVSIDQENKNNIIIQLKNGEYKKLPGSDALKEANFTVKLVDPTTGVRKGLLASSKEKPVSITIRGYAEICQQPPLVSLREATVAFKKS
jgi:hypothetical protein